MQASLESRMQPIWFPLGLMCCNHAVPPQFQGAIRGAFPITIGLILLITGRNHYAQLLACPNPPCLRLDYGVEPYGPPVLPMQVVLSSSAPAHPSYDRAVSPHIWIITKLHPRSCGSCQQGPSSQSEHMPIPFEIKLILMSQGRHSSIYETVPAGMPECMWPFPSSVQTDDGAADCNSAVKQARVEVQQA